MEPHCVPSQKSKPYRSNSFKLLGGLAALADEVLVLGNVLRPESDAEQVEPELAAVALNPVDLRRKKEDNFKSRIATMATRNGYQTGQKIV